MPYKLKQSGQKVEFGLSTRSYLVTIDYSRLQAAYEKRHRSLEQELEILQKLDNKDDLDVQTLKSTLGLVSKDTIFVSNFPYHFEEQDLENLFKDCGKVLNVKIPEDRMTRKSKGFAFVTMDSEKAARKGLNYDGHKVMNRPLKVRLAEKQQVESKPRVEMEKEKEKPR